MHIIETVFASLLSNSLRASILALGIFSIQWFFRHRLTPAWRHALWLPLLVSLALPGIPLLPAWPVASFTTAPQWQAPAEPVITAAPAETMGVDGVSEPFVRESVDAPLLPQASIQAVAQASETAAPAATASGFALKSLVAIVWVTGAIVLLVTGLLGYHRNMRKIRRSATQPDHKLQAAIAAAAEEAGLASAPLTWVSPVVSSPAVAGISRPVLLLPSAFPGELDASEVRLVLLHEFSHVKRLDLPLNWLSCLFLAAHWCNPLLWFAFARMRIDREKACDARVLAIDAGGQRTQYGETLIKLQISAPPHSWSLGFIGLFERGYEIKSRIRQIAAFRPGTTLSRITGVALLTLLMVFSLLKNGQAEAEPTPDAPAPADRETASALPKSDVPDEQKTQTASSDAPVTSKSSIDTINSTRDWIYLVRIVSAEDKAGKAGINAAWGRLRSLLAEMSEDELMAAHMEINGLPPNAPGLSLPEKEILNLLEKAILNNLELKNPEYAFSQHIANFENDERNTDELSSFHRWLARDPAAATAWYESEIAKGTFDKTLGDNYRLRLPFEAGFIRCLLTSDPAAAESRMNQIPPEQRYWLISYYLEASASDPKVLADLIRKTVSKKEQAVLVLSKAIRPEYIDDTAKILESLSRINATPEERFQLQLMGAARYLSFDKLDKARMKQYREWALAIEPSSVDRSAGLAFAYFAEKYIYHDYITHLANNYHGLGGGDDFIIGFVEGSGTRRTSLPLDVAREFATKIKDQTRRNAILEKLK